MKAVKTICMVAILAIAVFSATGKSHGAFGFNLSIGTDNFYFSVGGYDYCNYYDNYFIGGPYAPSGSGFSFHTALNDYGRWVYYGGLGNVWVPRVSYDWRPYTHGHWIYTAYGWTWSSYEPWGWIPHHYGHWLFTSGYGWIWVPGYTYYPARVSWISCGGYTGWLPIAPYGYDHYRGPWHGYYGFHHRPLYVNNVYINNYVFINNRYFGSDNVYGYQAHGGAIGDVFTNAQNRIIEMQKGPDRKAIEKYTGRKVLVRDMDVKEMSINGRKVAYHRPRGEIDNIRRYAAATVEKSIAPAFAEGEMAFKGTGSKNARSVDRLFGQEGKQVKTRTFKASNASRAESGRSATVSSTRNRSDAVSSGDSGKTITSQGRSEKNATTTRTTRKSIESRDSSSKKSTGSVTRTLSGTNRSSSVSSRSVSSGGGSGKIRTTTSMKRSPYPSKIAKTTTGKRNVTSGSKSSSKSSVVKRSSSLSSMKATSGKGKSASRSSHAGPSVSSSKTTGKASAGSSNSQAVSSGGKKAQSTSTSQSKGKQVKK